MEMTKTQVIDILKLHGLGKIRRRKWLDYAEAKKIIFRGEWDTSGSYNQKIGWISAYLKL